MGVSTSWFRLAPSTDEERPNVEEFPMHLAARNGDIEALKRLLDSGMSVDSRDGQGFTPLHYAALHGNFEVAEYLISSNCDLNVKIWDGKTPVFLATRARHKSVVELLVRSGADVKSSNADKWTVLHYAAYKGWLDVVRIIANKEGSNLNVKTSDGDTPLLMAARIRHKDIIEFLIESGANMNFSDNEKWTLLHYACYEGWTDIVQRIVAMEESRVDVKDLYGNTPLHMACYRQHVDVVRQLLKVGANVNVVNNNNETALNRLRKYMPNLDAIKLLIEHGACLNAADYVEIYHYPLLKEHILKNVELCAQAIVNQFNNEFLPALYCLPGFDQKLPHVKMLKINGTQRVASEIAAYVTSEIQTKLFCNVLEARPRVLKLMCVSSLINYKF